MLADNIILLKKKYPELYKMLKVQEEQSAPNRFILEKAKDGSDTMKFQSKEQMVYLHSKYNPMREAETLIEKIAESEEIDENTHVIFYGIGLGYHIEVFLNRFPKTVYTLYEPSVEMFEKLLDIRSIKKMITKNLQKIVCEKDLKIMNEYFSAVIENIDKRTVIIDLPVYKTVFSDQYNRFMEGIKDYSHQKRNDLIANYVFKTRWLINSVNNFYEVLNTPNILMENHNVFKGKVAILVSAGPSLDYEIENLKLIKERGLAYIFSVGSAINTLVQNHIYPDAMCTYDPSEENQMVFNQVNQLGINTIPMIYGSSIAYEVLDQYKGPKYHMITNQDTISTFLLKTNSEEELQIVHDAASIAVVALELLHKLQFTQVILVGQNLAYRSEKNYAEGIDYFQNANSEKIIETTDVEGNLVKTTDSFVSMRNQMEFYIKNSNISVINTTIGGAHIEGAQFMPMQNVIKNILNSKIVKGDEFSNIIKSDNFYDKEYLEIELNHITREFESYKKLLAGIIKQLNKLSESIKNNNTKQTPIIHNKMDSQIKKMEINDFFKVFVIPKNRVEYEMLLNAATVARSEKNEFIKAKRILKPNKSFFDLLLSDTELNDKIMIVLTKNINNYLNGRKA